MMGKSKATEYTCPRWKTAHLLIRLISRSLLNLLQQYDYWESFFGNIGNDKSKANLLGLLTNMFTIGSILSMFIV
jgi:hypothetical protein